MSLQKITHFFDGFRTSSNGKLSTLSSLKERARKLVLTTQIDKKLTKENFSAFLDELFAGNDDILKGLDADMIFHQLQCSLKGEEIDTFITCWDYWLREKTARTTVLVIVDVQNDFISGSLALKNCPAGEDGYDVISVINNILKQKVFDHVVYTMDWHPQDHCSFVDNVHKYPIHKTSPITAKEAKVFETVVYSHPAVMDHKMEQKLWPAHCVQDTWGSELHKDLKPPNQKDYVSKKGFRANVDSYSAFWSSCHLHQTDLLKVLLKKGVTDVFVCGLAFDICVKFTATDAFCHGFSTYVIEDACRGTSVDGNCQAKDVFKKDGIKLLLSNDLASHLGNLDAKSS